MNSVHVRVKIVGLLQQGDVQGVLQMAGRLERIEQRWMILRMLKLILDCLCLRSHDDRIDTHCESKT